MLGNGDEQKIFSCHSKSNSIVTETQFMMLPNLYRGRPAPREYRIEKNTVYSLLERHMTFPFVFADRYGPKEAYKHIC